MYLRKALPFLVFLAAIAIAVAGEVSTLQMKKPISTEQIFEPVGVENVQPCCMVGEEHESTLPPHKPAWKPEGNFFDEATLEMLKRQAEIDPRLPKGETFDYMKSPMASTAPRLLTTFDGINAEDAVEDGFIPLPPDTIVAAGPNNILTATNSILRLSSKTNTNVSFQSLRNHFKRGVEDFFDPKVIYDRFTNRFVIVTLIFDDSPRKSAIYISISKTTNPDSLSVGWCNYRINGVRNGSWADFPSIGVNENYFVLSVNQFGFADDNFKSAVVKVVDKKSFNNTASCPALSTTTFEIKDGTSFTLQPAVHNSPSNLGSKPLYLVSNLNGFSNLYQIWRLSGTPVQLSKIQLEGTNFSPPPNAKQKGGGQDLDTGDNRVLQAVFRNGAVWAVHSTGCSVGTAAVNESCVRVVRFVPTDSGATIDYEKTYGLANQFIWFPGIAVNKNGDAAVVFQRSSKSIFLGTAINGKKAGASTFDPITVMKGGTCHYELVPVGGTNRTGDFTGASIDPADDTTFWFAAEYGSKLPGSTRCLWATRIAHSSY